MKNKEKDEGFNLNFHSALSVLVMLVSVTTLAIISFDRMLGVVRPFHQHLKKKQSIAIIACIWLLSALFAVPFAIYRIYTVRGRWVPSGYSYLASDVVYSL